MSSIRIELDYKPRPHQRDAHEKRKRFSVLVWHRRAGKTVFAIHELVLAAFQAKQERARFAYVAPFLRQAKAVAWDILKHALRPVPNVSFNESELAADLPNGARIRLFGADNPDALRGVYFDGAVLDEVAQMRPEVWGEIIRPLLADRKGWALFIGTPHGVNLFSELYYRAVKGETGWYADLRRASETGALSAEELEKAKREMSSAQYAQEFECDFAAAVANALISLETVLTAQRRKVEDAEYRYAARVLGVDPARYGDDRTVMFPRQGLMAHRPLVMTQQDTMTTAARVAQKIDEWHPHAVFVDQTGLGAGVVDRLRQLQPQTSVIGIDFGGKALDQRYENRRCEMWWKLGEWLRDGGCLPAVPFEDGDLASELTGPTFDYSNARGRFALESKDDLKARGRPSPDLADALALTFAAPVAVPAHEDPTAGFYGRRNNRAITEYDPFNPPNGTSYEVTYG